MSSSVSFYGFIISEGADKEGYQFEIGDIYIKQRNKWLKADSSNVSKLYSNMDDLKAVKGFGFYTKTEQNNSRAAFRGTRFLKDAVENRLSGQKGFTLKIIAVTGDYGVVARCSDCELAQSALMPSPIGTIQSYEIKYKDALIEKLAGASGSK